MLLQLKYAKEFIERNTVALQNGTFKAQNGKKLRIYSNLFKIIDVILIGLLEESYQVI